MDIYLYIYVCEHTWEFWDLLHEDVCKVRTFSGCCSVQTSVSMLFPVIDLFALINYRKKASTHMTSVTGEEEGVKGET